MAQMIKMIKSKHVKFDQYPHHKKTNDKVPRCSYSLLVK